MRLETARLILRPLEESDAADLYPIISDPDVTDNLLIPYPFPEEHMIPWIQARREALEAKERYILSIVLKDTGRAIGVCGLVGVSWKHMNAELVYWLGKQYW
jgi:RimJ/RimL family protein N-acetyltransferase